MLGEIDKEVNVEVHILIFNGISVVKNYVRIGRKTKIIYLNHGNIIQGIAVLVSVGGHNEILFSRGLNNRNVVLLQFWRLEVQAQGVGRFPAWWELSF